jgi:hypothetical protein
MNTTTVPQIVNLAFTTLEKLAQLMSNILAPSTSVTPNYAQANAHLHHARSQLLGINLRVQHLQTEVVEQQLELDDNRNNLALLLDQQKEYKEFISHFTPLANPAPTFLPFHWEELAVPSRASTSTPTLQSNVFNFVPHWAHQTLQLSNSSLRGHSSELINKFKAVHSCISNRVRVQAADHVNGMGQLIERCQSQYSGTLTEFSKSIEGSVSYFTSGLCIYNKYGAKAVLMATHRNNKGVNRLLCSTMCQFIDEFVFETTVLDFRLEIGTSPDNLGSGISWDSLSVEAHADFDHEDFDQKSTLKEKRTARIKGRNRTCLEKYRLFHESLDQSDQCFMTGDLTKDLNSFHTHLTNQGYLPNALKHVPDNLIKDAFRLYIGGYGLMNFNKIRRLVLERDVEDGPLMALPQSKSTPCPGIKLRKQLIKFYPYFYSNDVADICISLRVFYAHMHQPIVNPVVHTEVQMATAKIGAILKDLFSSTPATPVVAPTIENLSLPEKEIPYVRPVVIDPKPLESPSAYLNPASFVTHHVTQTLGTVSDTAHAHAAELGKKFGGGAMSGAFDQFKTIISEAIGTVRSHLSSSLAALMDTIKANKYLVGFLCILLILAVAGFAFVKLCLPLWFPPKVADINVEAHFDISDIFSTLCGKTAQKFVDSTKSPGKGPYGKTDDFHTSPFMNTVRDASQITGLLSNADKIGRTFTSYVTALLNWSSMKLTQKPFFESAADVQAYQDEIQTMIGTLDTDNCDTLTQKRFFVSTYERLVQMSQLLYKIDSPMYTTALGIIMRLETKFIRLKSECSTECPRQRPCVAWFEGDTGVGKTFAQEELPKALFSWLKAKHQAAFVDIGHPTYSDGLVHTRRAENEFWEGYIPGQHWAVKMDDIFQCYDNADRALEALSVISMVGDAAYALHMASIDAKGSTYFTSKLLIMSSNVTEEGLDCIGISHPPAFRRRRDFLIEVLPRPGFKKIPDDAFTIRAFNSMRFSVRRLDIATNLHSNPVYLDGLTGWMQLVADIGKRYVYHYEIACHKASPIDYTACILLTEEVDFTVYPELTESFLASIPAVPATLQKWKLKAVPPTRKPRVPIVVVPETTAFVSHLNTTTTTSQMIENLNEPDLIDYFDIDDGAGVGLELLKSGVEPNPGPRCPTGYECLLGASVLLMTPVQIVAYIYKKFGETPKSHFLVNCFIQMTLTGLCTGNNTFLFSYIVYRLLTIEKNPGPRDKDTPVVDIPSEVEEDSDSETYIPYIKPENRTSLDSDMLPKPAELPIPPLSVNYVAAHFSYLGKIANLAKSVAKRAHATYTFYKPTMVNSWDVPNWLPSAKPQNVTQTEALLTSSHADTPIPPNKASPFVVVRSAIQVPIALVKSAVMPVLGVSNTAVKLVVTSCFASILACAVLYAAIAWALITVISLILSFIGRLFGRDKKVKKLLAVEAHSDDKYQKHTAELWRRRKPIIPHADQALESEAVKVEAHGLNSIDGLSYILAYNTLLAKFTFSSGYAFVGSMFTVGEGFFAFPRHFLVPGTLRSIDMSGTIFKAFDHLVIVAESPRFVLYNAPNRDLVYCFIPGVQPFRNLTKHLRSRKDTSLEGVSGTARIEVLDSDTVDGINGIVSPSMIHHMTNKSINTFAKHPETGEEIALAQYSETLMCTGLPSSIGKCSLPVMCTNDAVQKKLMGINTAGSNDSSYVAPMYIEDIEHMRTLVTAIRSQSDIQNVANCPINFADPLLIGCCPVKETPQAGFYEGMAVYAIIDKPGNFPQKTNIIPTPVKTGQMRLNEWIPPPYELKTAPAKLRTTEFINPLHLSFRKEKGRRMYFGLDLFPPEYWRGIFTEYFKDFTYRFLTLEEAINGIPTLGNFHGICLTTCTGHPWSQYGFQRSDLIVRDSPHPNVMPFVLGTKPHASMFQNRYNEIGLWVHPDLQEAIYMMFYHSKLGLITPAYFLYMLKDETRPLDRVNLGYTRGFAMGSIHQLIFCRMVLGLFISTLEKGVDHDTCVTVNPFSSQWTMLFARLSKHGNNFISHDVEAWDVNFFVQKFAPAFMYNFSLHCNVPLFSFEFHCVSNGIYGGLMGRYIMRSIVTIRMNMPSGWYYTTCVNTMASSVKNRSIWGELSTEPFDSHVDDVLGGDDSVISVDDESKEFFNGLTICKIAKEKFNHTHTSSTKGPITEKFDAPGSTVFYKRPFVECSGIYLAPLDPDTLTSMTQWIQKPRHGVSFAVQFMRNCHAALDEWSLHPREDFEKHKEILNGFLMQYGPTYLYTQSYDERRVLITRLVSQ